MAGCAPTWDSHHAGFYGIIKPKNPRLWIIATSSEPWGQRTIGALWCSVQWERPVGVTAEDFRRKSAACKTAAMLEGSQARKRELLGLAQAWLQLAEYTERHPDWQSQFVISDNELTERGSVIRVARRMFPDFRWSAENPRMM